VRARDRVEAEDLVAGRRVVVVRGVDRRCFAIR
jgi:hypothetical protein